MIKLIKRHEELVVSFPKIGVDVQLTIRFQRTHRIPDDGSTYQQFPEIEQFPLHNVDKHLEKVPGRWLEHGGVLVPMYQGEGVWIEFESNNINEYGRPFPFAVKIASGEINAVTGDEWKGSLDCDAQNYVVVPGQSRMDGFNIQQGVVRQFVAMPLGQGCSVEEQLREGTPIGGIQIMVYPMSWEAFARLKDPPVVFPQPSLEDLLAPGPPEAPPEEAEEPAAADNSAMAADDILAARGDEGRAAETVAEEESAGEEDASEADKESPPREGKVWLGLMVVLGVALGLVFAFRLKSILWLMLGSFVLLPLVFIKAFYKKCELDEALVRSGSGGARVALQGGMWVFGIIHNFQRVTLRTLKLNVKTGNIRSEAEGVTDAQLDDAAVGGEATKGIVRGMGVIRTSDSLPIILDAEVYVRVPRREEYIIAAATTMGEKIDPTPFKPKKRGGRISDGDLGFGEDQAAKAILELVEQKLRSAVRGAAASMTLSQMHTDRIAFTENVSEQLRQDLKENGLELEAFTIESLDQEPLGVVSETADENVFDANAASTLTAAIEQAQTGTNQAKRDNEIARNDQNTQFEIKRLALEQQQVFATEEQNREIANNEVSERARVSTWEAEIERERTLAVEEADIASTKKIEEVANEFSKAEIERERTLAVEEADLASRKKIEEVVRDLQVPPKLLLAAGGRIHQQIFADTYSPTDWDTSTCRGFFVHLVNSELWYHLTGNAPPREPLTAKEYNDAGLPWLDSYQEKTVVKGSEKLKGTKGVPYLPNNEPIAIKRVEKIRSEMEETQVREISIS